ncbi:MAG: PHP domain-containing protein, partial [Actinomycetales bacterium]
MSDPFVHLHVASGYSLRHGASHPRALVERAADHGMEALALTDRDGLYGAVRFALACGSVGLRPILGVDLAVAPLELELTSSPHRSRRQDGQDRQSRQSATPARGGRSVDPRHARVTVLASGAGGWAALCRLVSATHLRGERGAPVTTVDLVADHAARAVSEGGRLVVLLGPLSSMGASIARHRRDLAEREVGGWGRSPPHSPYQVWVLGDDRCGRGPRGGGGGGGRP